MSHIKTRFWEICADSASCCFVKILRDEFSKQLFFLCLTFLGFIIHHASFHHPQYPFHRLPSEIRNIISANEGGKFFLVSISLLSCALLSKLHLKILSFYSNAKDNGAFVAKAKWSRAWTFKITIEILLFLASIGKSYCHSSIPFQWLNVIVW